MTRRSVYPAPGLAFLLRDLRHMSCAAAPDLADWLIHLELEGKRDRTLYAYHRELARLLRAYPDHGVADFTGAEINAVLTTVPSRSRHIARSIYSGFFEWAMLFQRIRVSPMFQVARIKQPAKKATDVFSLADVARLEQLPSPDGPLFAVLFGSGIRRAEARRLRREHVDLPRRRLRVVDGKGGKDRDVALTPAAMQAVVDLTTLEGLNPPDHLWGSRPGGGNVWARYRPIGNTTFERWYRRCLTTAGVPYMRPHTTRHTFHELMRLAGLSLEERQLLMGHTSIRTTADIYGHIDFNVVADKLATFRLEAL